MYPDNNNNCNPFVTQSPRVLSTQWSRREDKLFEQALVMFPEGTTDRWHKIAETVPGKSSREVKEHYDMLLFDVYEIDSGRVEIPSYADDSSQFSSWDSDNQISFGSKSKQHVENERKKGTPWTEEEHKYVSSRKILKNINSGFSLIFFFKFYQILQFSFVWIYFLGYLFKLYTDCLTFSM